MEKEFSDVTSIHDNEVPKTICINCAFSNPSFLKHMIREGTRITPPPIPNSPAKKPENTPIIKNMRIIMIK